MLSTVDKTFWLTKSNLSTTATVLEGNIARKAMKNEVRTTFCGVDIVLLNFKIVEITKYYMKSIYLKSTW